MTVWVNWDAYAAVTSGLLVLLGLTWLLRGGRATARMCAVVGIADVAGGLAAGRLVMIAGGAIILGTACWCLRSLRGSGRRRTGGRA